MSLPARPGYLAWTFWSVVYLFRPRPKEFHAALLRGVRTWAPWWKFRPGVIRNRCGRMWEVYLSDEQTYTERRTIEVDVHVSQSTGRIVGLNLFDEVCEPKKV